MPIVQLLLIPGPRQLFDYRAATICWSPAPLMKCTSKDVCAQASASDVQQVAWFRWPLGVAFVLTCVYAGVCMCVCVCVYWPQLAVQAENRLLTAKDHHRSGDLPPSWLCLDFIAFTWRFAESSGAAAEIQQAQFDACNLSCIIFFKHIQHWTCYIILPQHSRQRTAWARGRLGQCRGVAGQYGLLFIGKIRRKSGVMQILLPNKPNPNGVTSN